MAFTDQWARSELTVATAKRPSSVRSPTATFGDVEDDLVVAPGHQDSDASTVDSGAYGARTPRGSLRPQVGAMTGGDSGVATNVSLRANSRCSNHRFKQSWTVTAATERYHTCRIWNPGR